MTEYYYQCLPKRLYQQGNYTLEAVQSEHIEKLRQWRNEQMDILRQSNPISKDDQIHYYEKNILSELNSDCPDNILLSLKYDNQLIGYGGLVNIRRPNSAYVCTEHTEQFLDSFLKGLIPSFQL
jgi:hypothetical protein